MRIFWVGAAIAIVGCGSKDKGSKEERCDRAYAEILKMAEDMQKSLGGGGAADKPSAADRQKFISVCSTLSDEALDCMTDLKRSMTPACQEIMAKAEAETVAKQPPVAIEWESLAFDHDRATAQVPRGWKRDSFMGEEFTPPDDAHLGMFTRYRVSSACGGNCDKQPAAEWAKRFADNEVGELAAAGAEIVRDEPVGDSGRLVIARSKTGGSTVTKLVLGQWSDGGEIYFVCEADLDARVANALADVERACRAMKVASFSSSY